ncbi:MAG TPA: hypothetical protein VII47_13970 [Actinomycetota bacterium]
MGMAHSDVEHDSEGDVDPALEADVEAALDAALEALTRTGWQDVDSAAASSVGDVQRLVKVAAELRRAVVALPSPQASLRHRAVISRVARGLHGGRHEAVHVL